MRRYFAISLLLLLMLPSAPAFVSAQAADCNPTPLYAQAATLKSSGDAKRDIDALMEFSDDVRQANIACNGFKFEGKSNQVIGPLDLAQGTWLVTLTTKTTFALHGTLLDGKCTKGGSAIDDFIFGATTGTAAEGMGVVIKSDGCRVLLTTEYASSPWTLTLESVS